MNSPKIIKIYIITKLIVTVSIIVLQRFAITLGTSILIFLIVDICCLFFLYRFIYMPQKKLKKVLDKCMKDEDIAIGLLENHKKDIAFIGKIKTVVDICSLKATRDNFATIYDKQAELAALQSQINPHFLYNTLDTIRGQALIDDNTEIAKMVEALACFFRYGISRKGELVTLREEVANVQNYMVIQQYRFDNRFLLQILIDKEDEVAYDYLVPRLIIQPIIENAIYHGMRETLENGVITLEIILTEKNLILMISDNGQGMDSETLMQVNDRIKSTHYFVDSEEGTQTGGTGIALPNINKRIRLLFGEDYGLNVYSTLDIGTDVEIMIPANYKKKAVEE